jgi:predicted adenylyl cyclase CyaB
MPVNIEIKARSADPSFIREWLLSQKALFKGTDLQSDTYFHVPKGRLKLRQGNIENNLIFYERPDQSGPKQSDFSITPVNDPTGLLTVLSNALGVWITVQKKREIYFLENVKFHIDEVEGLGSFIEIEAGDLYADIPVEQLRVQCDHYLNVFGIRSEDLIDRSYSDLLMDMLS